MLKLLDEMLKISRVESGKRKFAPENADIRELCSNITRELQIAAKQSHKINFKYSGSIDQIIVDSQLLSQILSNLLSNSIKYSPRTDRIDFFVKVDSKSASFTIRDFGIGITEKNKNLIFNMFHRSKNVGKIQETGLGLSIVKSYVELHKGKIEVETEAGKGSSFTVTIPHLDTETVKELTDVDWKGKHILVVENNEISRVYQQELLDETKAEIYIAVNDLEAVDLLKTKKEIDLILMDIQMPEMDGITATLKIREINQAVPIIAISAFVTWNHEKKSMKSGCNEFIMMPINRTELLVKINKYI